MSAATDMLAAYLAAESAVLLGKTVKLSDRLVTLEDLPMIRAGRQEWEHRVNAELRNGKRTNSIGGLEMSVANFNNEPHSARYNRNRGY